MGRTYKRVSLDFDWPLKNIWKGYVNPYGYWDCRLCKQTGYNQETLKIKENYAKNYYNASDETIEKLAKQQGVYGYCSLCDGDGIYFHSDEFKELHENFEGVEPPLGDGW